MKKLFLSVMFWLPAICTAQSVPIPSLGAPNPFIGANPVEPIPPIHRAAAPAGRLDHGLTGLSEQGLPADVRTVLEGMALIGRNDQFAIIGTTQQTTPGISGPGGTTRQLKTVTVKDGGAIFVAGRKLKVRLDPVGTGVYIAEASENAQPLWYVDLDAQRTLHAPQVHVEGPVSGGVGVGMSPNVANWSSRATNSATQQANPQAPR